MWDYAHAQTPYEEIPNVADIKLLESVLGLCGRGQLVDLDGVGADEAGGGDDGGDGGPERLDAAVLGEDEEGERQVGEEEGDDEGEAGEAEVGEYEGEADDPEYGFRLQTEGT